MRRCNRAYFSFIHFLSTTVSMKCSKIEEYMPLKKEHPCLLY